MANSEDLDEMPPFHQGLYSLLRQSNHTIYYLEILNGHSECNWVKEVKALIVLLYTGL